MAFLFLSLLMTGMTVVISSDSLGLEEKSRKNWFTKDIVINQKKVTWQDLLNSPGADWLVYYGDLKANHFSPLSQINKNNVARLVMKWTYKITESTNLRSSPVIYDGIMYVTAANEVHALDVRTGQWLWVWQAYAKRSAGINRGVAIYGDKIFFSTSDCKLVALNKETGNLVWATRFVDTGSKYFSTMAPLVVKDTVIMGVASNNDHERGFIAAFSVTDGKELWRTWTLPAGSGLMGAPTWLTGSYDPTTETIFWPVGTLPERQRLDTKLYETPHAYHDGVLALNVGDGKIKWHTRFAKYLPVDWDSNEPLVLVDNLLLQANRNGMFYIIDRDNGNIIFDKSFIDKIKWSKQDSCPSARGATNWMSPSYSRITKLFYVAVLEGCADESNSFYIKALDPWTGEKRWGYLTRGNNIAAPGVLSTGGNIVFSGEGSGHFVALNGSSGEKLWEFNTGRPIFASPVTYSIDGKQYVSFIAGSEVFTFSLFTASR